MGEALASRSRIVDWRRFRQQLLHTCESRFAHQGLGDGVPYNMELRVPSVRLWQRGPGVTFGSSPHPQRREQDYGANFVLDYHTVEPRVKMEGPQTVVQGLA